MTRHIAYLSDPYGFDASTRIEKDLGDGVLLFSARRPGSNHPEGMAYAFEATLIDPNAALAWLQTKRIKPVRLDLSDTLPAFVPMEFEGLESGRHTDRDGRVLDATPEFLTELAENSTRLYRAGKLRAPQKLGHGDDQSSTARWFPQGGEPAVGWLAGARVVGTKLMVSASNVPRKFEEAVRNKIWRRVSLEISPDYRGDGPAIIAAAWHGATRTSVQTIADYLGLSASDAEQYLTTVHAFDEGATFCFGDAAADPGSPVQANGGDVNPETQDSHTEGNEMSKELEAQVLKLQEQLDTERENAKKAQANALDSLVGVTMEPHQLESEKANVMQFSGADAAAKYVESVRNRPKVKDLTKPVGSNEHKPDDSTGSSYVDSRKAQIWAFSESSRKSGTADRAGIAICQEEAEYIACCEEQQRFMKCDYLAATVAVDQMRPDLSKAMRASWYGGN